MDLYRYRTVDSAIRDIESGTFYFASKEELNDGSFFMKDGTYFRFDYLFF